MPRKIHNHFNNVTHQAPKEKHTHTRWYNEGRLAAVMGDKCPHKNPWKREQWLEGYRHERDLMQIRGQIGRE